MRKNGWTPEEDELLRKAWPAMKRKEAAALFPKRSLKAVAERAKALGVGRSAPSRSPKAPRGKRENRFCFWYIKGGPVASVFQLGETT